MRWILTLVLLTLPTLAAGQDAPALKTDKEKLSYAMGMDLGNQLKSRSVDIDPAIFAQALKDALSGGKTLLTDAEAKAVITELQKAMLVKQAAEAKVVGDKNKAEGDAYMAANKAKDGVISLPNGIQYKVLTAGTGKQPTIEDTVVCQYPRHPDRRQGVRQLLQERPAGHVSAQEGHQGVGRSAAAHARRVEVAGGHPAGARVRGPRGGRRHRAERHARLRDRAGRHQVARRRHVTRAGGGCVYWKWGPLGGL